MSQTIFGWVGAKDIYEFLKQEFKEENDQKKINNILTFKIQTKLTDEKLIKPNVGVNKWTVDTYRDEIKNKKPTFISLLYRTKYSAYNKIYSLQKYIDLINCKYGSNLKINFHYNEARRIYTFILYFSEPGKDISYDQISGYIKTWNRIKNNLNDALPPGIHALG